MNTLGRCFAASVKGTTHTLTLYCTYAACSIREGGYPCLSGECVEISALCDGDRDCTDGSDEENTVCNEMTSKYSSTSWGYL